MNAHKEICFEYEAKSLNIFQSILYRIIPILFIRKFERKYNRYIEIRNIEINNKI